MNFLKSSGGQESASEQPAFKSGNNNELADISTGQTVTNNVERATVAAMATSDANTVEITYTRTVKASSCNTGQFDFSVAV